MGNLWKDLSHMAFFKTRLFLAAYRGATLVVALAIALVISSPDYFVFNRSIILAVAFFAGAVFSISLFLYRNKYRKLIISVVAVDMLVCVLLITFSGGLNSPFILYSISPILTAALVVDKKSTFIFTGILIVAVAVSLIFNPFYDFRPNIIAIGSFCTYVVAAGMISMLPYIVNINLKQKLENEKVQQERQRLSREIHDGVAQTLLALCWQTQSLKQQAVSSGNTVSKEIEELDKLAKKARKDVLDSLEILRNSGNSANLLSVLKNSLQSMKEENNIDYSLHVSEGNLKLNNAVELELARITQEALANIKKHAGAHSVEVKLQTQNGLLVLCIKDDGKGFEFGRLLCQWRFHQRSLRPHGHAGTGPANQRQDAGDQQTTRGYGSAGGNTLSGRR